MAIARPNGQPQDVVRHLVTKCGVHVDVAERLVPNREGVEDSPRTALTPEALDTYRRLVEREYVDAPSLRAVLLLLPVTGLRVAEICNLTKDNVRREGDKVSWKFHGKGDKERTVPLWKKARRVYEPYIRSRRPGYFLFPNQSDTGPIAPAKVQEACRHLASLDPSLQHLTPHVLRHTFATMALLNCHDIKRTQEILGHGKKNSVKIPVVMLRYLHPDVERSTPNSPRTLAVRKNPGQTVGMPIRPFAAELAKRTDKAKENPMRDDDWYWKAIYSNVPPGPSRAHPVAQRNPKSEIHYTSKGQPYVYMNGRPRFIKKSEAKHARKNGWAQVIEPFSVSEEKLGGRQPIARRNPKKKKASAKKNHHMVWEQIISPFSVSEARTYGRQPIGRRNPDIWKQVIEPFSVSEERIGGLQPIARRNTKKKKSKAKKNGALRIYKVK